MNTIKERVLKSIEKLSSDCSWNDILEVIEIFRKGEKKLNHGQWPETVVIYTDGACRGNPGPSSLGVYVLDQQGQLVAEISEAIGVQTNNYAEYMAMVRAFEMAIEFGSREVFLKADSQLMVKQMIGEYRVKAEGIKPLFAKAKELERQLQKVSYEHVKRELNREADRLANEALDSKILDSEILDSEILDSETQERE